MRAWRFHIPVTRGRSCKLKAKSNQDHTAAQRLLWKWVISFIVRSRGRGKMPTEVFNPEITFSQTRLITSQPLNPQWFPSMSAWLRASKWPFFKRTTLSLNKDEAERLKAVSLDTHLVEVTCSPCVLFFHNGRRRQRLPRRKVKTSRCLLSEEPRSRLY